MVVGTIDHADRVDDLDPFHSDSHQLLGELLVIKGIDATAEHHAVAVLFDVQPPQIKDPAAGEGRFRLGGQVGAKRWGQHPLYPPSVTGTSHPKDGCRRIPYRCENSDRASAAGLDAATLPMHDR